MSSKTKKNSKSKRTATTATKAKAKTTPVTRITNEARLARAVVAGKAIMSKLVKGGELTTASVRATLRHPLLPKGIVCSCFARKDHVVVLLPALGAMLKVKETDPIGNPFVTLANGSVQEEGVKLGIRINKILSK